MRRCAIYARYSSDLQSPTSIEDQIRVCRAYAERQGWAIVATYHDAEISGSTDHRPDYQRLVAAALAPAPSFNTVLVEDLSRITRDTAETLLLYHRVHSRGIALVGVSDGINTDAKGAKLQLGIKGLMNELYLDDLGEKTHRGLSGLVGRGLSAGGRIFGYRAVSGDGGAVLAIEPTETDIVRRIFRDYAAGRSMKTIAFALNRDGVPFPAKDTKRGPARRGWAVSTIQVLLRNEKYAGVWVWNKTRFVRDRDTGKRRPRPRPPHEWVRQERPELRIIDPALWAAVSDRLRYVSEHFACGKGHGAPKGGARAAFSPYLLSGLLRCGACGARMVTDVTTRKKGGEVYRYVAYTCGFARYKGPAVCQHRTRYRQDKLEGGLVDQFHASITPALVDTLTDASNRHIERLSRERGRRAETLKTELVDMEHQVANLVRFIARGDSEAVRAELWTVEAAMATARAELAALERDAPPPLRMHRSRIAQEIAALASLLREDPVRARVEIAKHLDGDLTIAPLPGEPDERRAEVTGDVKHDGLLGAQEAVRLQMVAGAGFEPATFGL